MLPPPRIRCGVQLRIEFQQWRVENETAAIAAVVGPILTGLLYSRPA